MKDPVFLATLFATAFMFANLIAFKLDGRRKADVDWARVAELEHELDYEHTNESEAACKECTLPYEEFKAMPDEEAAAVWKQLRAIPEEWHVEAEMLKNGIVTATELRAKRSMQFDSQSLLQKDSIGRPHSSTQLRKEYLKRKSMAGKYYKPGSLPTEPGES